MVAKAKLVASLLLLGIVIADLTTAAEKSGNIFLGSESAKSFHRDKRYVDIPRELRRESDRANSRIARYCRSIGKRHCPSRYGGRCC
ncbi:hypothetical protein SNE40_002609 [Patella caerulea]|uniref:Uncharacterized protein n=1 Tax=Patella caerulea TaxID=87958 RepID=A0AAN8K687_PATCE